MNRALVMLSVLTLTGAVALADGVVPPSGQTVTLFDLLLEPEADMARFRFLAPGLQAAGHDAVADDFQWLCEQVALAELAAEGWTVTQVVISLHDREVPFGASDPDAVQFFEGFSLVDGACVWEPF